MTPLVCMSLEDHKRSVSTAIVIAFQTHQDCGDVIYLISILQRYKAFTSTSVMIIHLVSKHNIFCKFLTLYTAGILQLDSIFFTLHTEPSVSPPEFSIICRTHGGPVTTVEWFFPVPRDGSTTVYSSSQIIVDTSHSVYDNTLVIRSTEDGNYQCNIENSYFPSAENNIISEAMFVSGMVGTSMFRF